MLVGVDLCKHLDATDQEQDHLLVGYDQYTKSRLGGHVQSDDKRIVEPSRFDPPVWRPKAPGM